jgi:hypothetical protein
MKYLCTSETLFATINKLNEDIKGRVVREVGEILLPSVEKTVERAIKSTKNYFYGKPTISPLLDPAEKQILNNLYKPPATYPLVPYKAPANTNPIVHAPPQEIGIPGRNTKGQIAVYRKPKAKNEIEPYKFEKIKADTDPKPIVKPDPKPKVKEPKPKVKEAPPKFGFPFGGIDTPNRGAGSINEPASISDLPLNLRVDSIGSYATRQRM